MSSTVYTTRIISSFSAKTKPGSQKCSSRVHTCKVMNSKKKPVWLVWQNPDPLADLYLSQYKLIFKNGDGILYTYYSYTYSECMYYALLCMNHTRVQLLYAHVNKYVQYLLIT